MKARTATIALGTIALLAALTGCSLNVTASGERTAQPNLPATTETSEATPTATPTVPVPVAPESETDYAAPGSGFKIGKAASIQFQNTNDQMAVIAAKPGAVKKVAAAQYAAIVKETPEVKGMDVYTAQISIKKVGGAAVQYGDASGSFALITKDKLRTQVLGLIGFDFCEDASFPNGFDTNGKTITTCIASAVPAGADKPVGVQFDQYDTQYDWYQGQPVTWLP